jgi:hypothetical protein
MVRVGWQREWLRIARRIGETAPQVFHIIIVLPPLSPRERAGVRERKLFKIKPPFRSPCIQLCKTGAAPGNATGSRPTPGRREVKIFVARNQPLIRCQKKPIPAAQFYPVFPQFCAAGISIFYAWRVSLRASLRLGRRLPRLSLSWWLDESLPSIAFAWKAPASSCPPCSLAFAATSPPL